ncbi:MAG: hypothetical protein FWC18_04890 [Cystobacterineae bacterium]|nr:hypothetical protein [Cystobacterineae bacterium]MCL2259140.1 hypothetical protein [Cystobacterineae bacterium]
MRLPPVCILACTLLLPYAAPAQETPLPQAQIPASPAQEILQTKPQVLITPGTTAELSASLSNVVSSTGEVNPGAAIEVSLRKLGVGNSPQYFHSYWTRFLARTSFSLATASLPNKNIGLSVGARWVVWDEDEPLLNPAYVSCSAQNDIFLSTCENSEEVHKMKQACKEKNPTNPEAWGECHNEADPVVDKCTTELFQKCLAQKSNVANYQALLKKYANAWKGNTFIVGAAVALRFPDGRLLKAQGNALALWSALGLELGEHAQLVLSASWQQRLGPGSGFHAAGGGLRLRVGNDSLRGFAEFAVTAAQPQPGEGPHTVFAFPVALGAEFPLWKTAGVWLHLGLGATLEPAHWDRAAALLISSLNFGTGPAPPDKN